MTACVLAFIGLVEKYIGISKFHSAKDNEYCIKYSKAVDFFFITRHANQIFLFAPYYIRLSMICLAVPYFS